MNDPMKEQSSYQVLAKIFDLAQQVCDPIEFEYRQKYLLTYLCKYVLEKDLPKDEIKKNETCCN